MKTLLTALILTFSLAGCTQTPAHKPEASDVRATDVYVEDQSVSNEDPSVDPDYYDDYQDEGQPDPVEDSSEAYLSDHFRVHAQPNFQGSDAITIQKITENDITITDVKVNRGNCELLSKPDPKKLAYAATMSVYLFGCTADRVLEIEITTDKGHAVYQVQ